MGMSTNKIKGEDYYQCRDVKAERDKLLEEVAKHLHRLEAAEKELAELRSSMKFRTSLIGRTEAERDDLRAELDAMKAWKAEAEKKEPVAWVNAANLASAEIERGRGGQGDTHTWAERPTTYHTEALYACPIPPAPSVPDVDFLADRIAEFADHNVEHGRMSFDKWSLRDAVESVLAAAPKQEETK